MQLLASAHAAGQNVARNRSRICQGTDKNAVDLLRDADQLCGNDLKGLLSNLNRSSAEVTRLNSPLRGTLWDLVAANRLTG